MFGCEPATSQVFIACSCLLMFVSIVQVVTKTVYVRIVEKPPAPRTCFRSLASSRITMRTSPFVWPMNMARTRETVGKAPKSEIQATPHGTSYASRFLRTRSERDISIVSPACYKETVMGTHLKPLARAGADTKFCIDGISQPTKTQPGHRGGFLYFGGSLVVEPCHNPMTAGGCQGRLSLCLPSRLLGVRGCQRKALPRASWNNRALAESFSLLGK